jgi:hypothetical protein
MPTTGSELSAGSYGAPTREETVRISLDLDGKLAKELQPEIKRFVGEVFVPGAVGDTDAVSLQWSFHVYYFGDIERRLSAALKLLRNPGIVLTANFESLTHAEFLLGEVAAQIKLLRAQTR